VSRFDFVDNIDETSCCVRLFGQVIVTDCLDRFGAWLMHLFMLQVGAWLMHMFMVQVDVWYMLAQDIGTSCLV
jgi:hypothetical protein